MFPTFFLMFAVIVLTVVGDYFLKVAALRHGSVTLPFVTGLVFYGLSGIAVLVAMRSMSFASFGVWSSVLTIVIMAVAGTFLFGEKLATRELLGIGFALASLACMSAQNA